MPILEPKARLIASADGKRKYEILAIAVGQWHPSKKGATGKPIYSTEESLRASVAAFEGLPVAAYEIKPGMNDHLPDGVLAAIRENGITFLKNRVGRLTGARFGETGNEKGIIVKFDVSDPVVDEIMFTAITGGRADFDGFSIDGTADWTVEKIDGVEYDIPWIKRGETLDMVKYPAAGGKVLRLAASQTLEDTKMNLTAKQRATIIAVLVAAGVGDEILNNLMASAPDAFINKGRELLAKEREFLTIFDNTLKKFERGENVEVKTGTGEPVKDAKALAEKEAADKKAADEKAAAEEAAKVKAEADKKEKAEAAKKPDPATDPAVKQAEELVKTVADQDKSIKAMETELGEARIEREVTASHLPDITKKQITERLKASRTYDVKAIKDTLDKEASYLKDLLGDQFAPLLRVTGSVSVPVSEFDQYVLAARAMLIGNDAKRLAALQKEAGKTPVKAFRSLREFNSRVTGSRYDEPLDRVFQKLSRIASGLSTNSMFDENGRLTASFSTSDLASVFLVAMHNQFLSDYKDPSQYDQWRLIAKVVNLSDLYAHAYTRSGWYAAAPSISEGGTYTEISAAPTDENISLTAVKYGHIMSITDKMVLNDQLGEFQRLQRALADGMKRDTYIEVMNIIRTNAAVAYGSDTDTLVHTNHSNGAASGGTSMAAADTADLEAGWSAMYNQAEFGSSAKLGDLNKPKYLLVHPTYLPRALALTRSERAIQTATTSGEYPANASLPDTGILNTIKENAVIPLPILNTSTSTDWWLVADPNTTPAPAVVVGFLNGVEQPELVTEPANTGSNFTADKIRIKSKIWRDSEPGDHRGIYGQLA